MDNNLLTKLNNGDIFLVNSRFLQNCNIDASKNYYFNEDFSKYKL